MNTPMRTFHLPERSCFEGTSSVGRNIRSVSIIVVAALSIFAVACDTEDSLDIQDWADESEEGAVARNSIESESTNEELMLSEDDEYALADELGDENFEEADAEQNTEELANEQRSEGELAPVDLVDKDAWTDLGMNVGEHEFDGETRSDDADLDLQAHVMPSAASTTCIVDNDWTGSNVCDPNSHHSGWSSHQSGQWSYYYDDVRYTSSKYKTGSYYWNAPKSGFMRFYVWIPSNKATADVEYNYYCASGPGDYSERTRTINQNIYYGEWVYLGSRYSTKGYTCGIRVKKSESASYSELMAMDAALAIFY